MLIKLYLCGLIACQFIKYIIMRKIHKITVIFLALLFIAGVARSQNAATVPYYCDFENLQERSDWVFSNDYINIWIIDTAVNNGGMYSLYITPDSAYKEYPYLYFLALSNSYAYRKIHFNAGLYNISFDWYNPGLSNYISFTYMRVFLIPATATFIGGQRYQGLTASRLPQNAIPVDFSGAQLINGYPFDRFSNPTVQIPATGDYYLVFFFFNDGQFVYYDPNIYFANGPAIDNINITAVSCQRPQALVYSNLGNGCISLDWDDVQIPTPTSWNIEYGPRGFQVGSGTQVAATSHPHTICGLQADSTYDFYVRANCRNGSTSSYSDVLRMCYKSETYLCRNFCDLKAPGTICTYGQYEEHGDTIGEFYGPYSDTGIVNFGYQNYGDPNTMLHASRHTVHTDPAEFDSCSGYRLHTVPLGEASSVRLGAVYGRWICQSISYDITVDSTVADLLMLKYACVLFNPDNHDSVRKPRFILEVLDSSNNLVDRGCYFADFTPDNVRCDSSWHTGIDNFTYWHDWTPVGLNIANYHGQNLTVRLTTYACGQGAEAHFGYAYYNLKCEKSRIKAKVCGNLNSPYIAEFLAPEGFRYHWYSPHHPGFSSTDQSILVALDNTRYYCDVFFGNDSSNCKFTLSVIANSDLVERQYTHADFSYTKDSSNCSYKATFENLSYTSNSTRTEIAYDCDYFYWDYGDGTADSGSVMQNNLTHSFPSYGTYNVMLVAGKTILGCYDTIYKTVTFAPPEVPVIHGDTLACRGVNNHIWVEGQTFVKFEWNTGDTTRAIDRTMIVPYTFSVHVTDFRGCEADDSIFVRVAHRPRIVIDTTNYVSCNPLTVNIIDHGLNADSCGYFWDWGDGTTSYDTARTQHTYHTPGRYNILCIATTVPGCADTAHLYAYSYGYTKADFRWHSFFGRITESDMFFQNISSPNEPEQNYYKWEFFSDTVDTIPIGISNDFETYFHWPVSDNSDVGFYRARLVAYTPIRTPENEFRCEDSIDYIIYILNDFLQFPNVITPNGDGVNDIFEIKNLLDGGNYTDNELYIYNHWGRLVYYKHNITTREDFWDPSLTNEMTGTYYYRFSAKGHTGNVQRNGVVEILR